MGHDFMDTLPVSDLPAMHRHVLSSSFDDVLQALRETMALTQLQQEQLADLLKVREQ